jgi:hypothetical protein
MQGGDCSRITVIPSLGSEPELGTSRIECMLEPLCRLAFKIVSEGAMRISPETFTEAVFYLALCFSALVSSTLLVMNLYGLLTFE